MPIQPRSPTRRQNSGTSVSSRLGLLVSKVPRAFSSARKARTSLRSCSHFSGRRIGSKRGAAVMMYLVSLESARGPQRPEFCGGSVGNEFAELNGPKTLRAEIVAPGQRPQREAVQNVLDGETDRAVHLVGDGAALFGRFRAADFCRGRF